jgi:hypothetical protein
MQPDQTPRQPEQGDAFAGECGDPIWECDQGGEMRENPAFDPHAAPQRPPAAAMPPGRIINLDERRPGGR